MMPDLGKYTVEVLSAYGVSILLILLLVCASLSRGRRTRDTLRKVEQRRSDNG
ncbi:MAG: heme exporter protein CcmD [Pseudoruegeria sp.]